MLSFRLATLNSVYVSSDVLAAWEMAAFFLGEASIDTLPIDEDEARIHYIENYVPEADKADYLAEPQLADAEMMEGFAKSLADQARMRIDQLGEHYPFDLDDQQRLIRNKSRPINPVGSCYLALQFFRGLAGSTLEIEGTDDNDINNKKAAFERQFRNVFEYIAGYVVSGDNNGAAFMTSDCRSSVRLERLLASVCRKVGAGRVRPHADWNLRQQAANDGGVDCLVHIGGPGASGNAKIALVGATVQKSSIDEKIIGPEKRDFFRSFFAAQPTAFEGVLVRVQDEDALTKDKCVQKDCLLYTYDHCWRSMGQRHGGDYQASSLHRLDAKVRRPMKNFSEAIFLHEYEAFNVQLG